MFFSKDSTNEKQLNELLERVTKLEEENKLLKEKLDAYEGLLDTVQEAIYVQDKDSRFLYVNKGAVRVYGYAQEEFLGKTPEFLSPPGRNDLSAVQKLVEKAFQGQPQSFEFWGLRKDGSIFPKLVNLSPGRFFGKDVVIALAIDVTQLKAVEAESRSIHERLSTLIDLMPDIVCFKDGHGRWEICNEFDRKLFGIEHVDYRGKKDSDLAQFSPFYFDAFMACEDSDEIAWKKGEPSRSDETIPTQSGEVKIFDIIKVPTYNDDGSRKGLVVVGRDVTERRIYEKDLHELNDQLKVSEAKLKDINVQKDKLFSIIAHDLKNPFHQIIGLSQLLFEDASSYNMNDVKQMSEIIFRSSKQGYEILENLLEWSRTQTDRIVFKPEVINLPEAINEALSRLAMVAKQKRIEIEFQPSCRCESIADRNMVLTVLRNLLTNAIKFSKKDSKVAIRLVKINETFCKISVIDQGIGIPEQDIEKLFRIDIKYSRKGTQGEQSTGLGLILCKEFVEKNGGTLEVTSKEDEGSIFSFTLPLAMEKESE